MSILEFLSSAKQVIITFFVFISMMFSSVSEIDTKYTAKNEDELVMSFSVISDTHIETTNPERYKQFYELLYGIKAYKNNDAVVYLGDNVMNGQYIENLLFYSTVNKILPDENNFVVLGNHDIGNGEGNYDKLCKSFIKNNSKHLGNNIEKPYYYKIVNGCYMIFLASEDLSVNKCVMAEEQYSWLKDLLNKAERENAKIFVFNHHPIYSLSGIDSYSLVDLLCQYDNLIYFNGHTHMRFSEYSFRNIYGVDIIYLPRSLDNESETGEGVVVEVYQDEVIVRVRNFTKSEWVDYLEYSYPMN